MASGTTSDRGTAGIERWWGLSTGSVQRLDLVMDEREKGKWRGRVGEEGRPSPTSGPMQHGCEVEALESRAWKIGWGRADWRRKKKTETEDGSKAVVSVV